MKFLATHSTRRVVLVCLIVLLAGILAVTALATSIPAQVIVNFEGLGFTDGTPYGSGLFTQGDFTFNLSAGQFAEGAGMYCFGGTGGCINATGVGPESITIQTTSTNTFNFASFWDLNVCGGGIASVQGYLNGTLVVTQTTGFPVDSSPCMGTPGTVMMASGFQNVNKVVLVAQGTGFADNLDQFIFNTTAVNQTITFTNPGLQSFGTSPTLVATATSGLTVVFTSLTPGVCTITSGGTLTFVGTGTCTINANQPGNGNYFAAPQVSQTFSVAVVAPGAPGLVTATAGNAQASVAFTPPASNGGAPINGYTVTSSPGGITRTGVSSPITVTGLANGTTYSFTVTATNSAGTGPASAPSNSVTPEANLSGTVSVVSGSGQTGMLGTPFAAPLVVLVEDGSGSPIANATVSFNVITGFATLNPASATTGSDGTAKIKATPTASGVITIWGTVSGISGAAVFVETGLSSTTSQLSVLPSALTFTAVQGGGNPLPASIAVSNTGTGNLPWTASASGSPSWLTLSSASGGTPAVITAGINTTGLSAGSYQSTVTVTSGSQQQTVGVSLTVQPSTPAQFTLTPSALVVNASAGSTTPVSQSISVANAGSGALAWTATANSGAASGWLSIASAASGTAPATVAVQINPTGLAAGQYLGNISFSAQGVTPSSVAVILNVSALPDLTSTVPVLEFRGPVGTSFSSQTLPVTTTTGASVSITATATLPTGMSWLSISGGSGGTPASITASVNTSRLAAGYYVGYILVQSSGARNTLAIPVVLDLGGAAPSGTLSASPGGVLLTGQSGTLTQTVTLSSDATPFSWNASTLTSTGNWLSVSPGSGSGNGPITVTANLAGLSPGSYTGQVAITSASTSNSQLIVPVTLIVSAATAVTSTNTLQPVAPCGRFYRPAGHSLRIASLDPEPHRHTSDGRERTGFVQFGRCDRDAGRLGWRAVLRSLDPASGRSGFADIYGVQCDHGRCDWRGLGPGRQATRRAEERRGRRRELYDWDAAGCGFHLDVVRSEPGLANGNGGESPAAGFARRHIRHDQRDCRASRKASSRWSSG